MRNFLFDTLFHTRQDDSTCIELADNSRISYAELFDLSGRVANVLSALGVKPGDRVAAQIDKSVAAVALYLGTVRAGAVYLPLNTAYTASEIEYFVADARPALLICSSGNDDKLAAIAKSHQTHLETLDANGRGGSWAERVKNSAPEFLCVTRSADDLAAILYTSGTTGRAKGAMITHNNLASNARTLADYWQFAASDVLLHALPIFHTHGLFVAINVVLISNASMVFLPRYDAAQVLELLPRCNVMMGVPTFYTRLLALDKFDRDAVAHMRLFISGSAPMTLETHREFQQRTGLTILERYGMTETNMNTSNPVVGDRIQGSVGLPLPGISLRITDPSSSAVRELGREEIGMIEVMGPNVFKGYWQMPDKTAQEIRPDGFFITGDLGKIDQQGYVYIVGRDKDLIISGGFNVYPKEIEVHIDRLEGIVESAVIGVTHADFGEAVIAVVVAQSPVTIDEKSIINALGDNLARYKIPKRVFFIDELPRNAMSKVQKKILRDNYADIF